MAYNFRKYDRDEILMFPPSLRDLVAEGDMSWFIVDAVDQTVQALQK